MEHVDYGARCILKLLGLAMKNPAGSALSAKIPKVPLGRGAQLPNILYPNHFTNGIERGATRDSSLTASEIDERVGWP